MTDGVSERVSGQHAEIRIEQLAQRVSISSRNIRAYQERGLLPPPTIRARIGYYSEEHVHRLELIRGLQDRGFSLEAIRQVLDAWSRGGDIADLLGLRRIISDPWAEEVLVELTDEDIRALFPEVVEEPALLARALRLGLLEPENGRYSTPVVLIQVGVALLRIGLSLQEVLALALRLQRDTEVIARHLIAVTSRQLLEPVADGVIEPEQLHDLTQTTLELRNLTIDVVRPFLARELDRAIDAALDGFRERIERGARRRSPEPVSQVGSARGVSAT